MADCGYARLVYDLDFSEVDRQTRLKKAKYIVPKNTLVRVYSVYSDSKAKEPTAYYLIASQSENTKVETMVSAKCINQVVEFLTQ